MDGKIRRKTDDRPKSAASRAKPRRRALEPGLDPVRLSLFSASILTINLPPHHHHSTATAYNSHSMSFFFVRSSDQSAPASSIASSSSSSSASLSTTTSSHTHTRRRRTKARRSSSSSASPKRSPTSISSLLPSVIPDMRFEQSYLASVRGFIHELSEEEATREKREAGGEGEGGEFVVAGRMGGAGEEKDDVKSGEEKGHGEPELWIGRLRVDWYVPPFPSPSPSLQHLPHILTPSPSHPTRLNRLPLIRITLRDQIYSTLTQGIMWSTLGVFAGEVRGALWGSVAAWGAKRKARGGGWSSWWGRGRSVGTSVVAGLRRG